jgi:hypothetical protein
VSFLVAVLASLDSRLQAEFSDVSFLAAVEADYCGRLCGWLCGFDVGVIWETKGDGAGLTLLFDGECDCGTEADWTFILVYFGVPAVPELCVRLFHDVEIPFFLFVSN